jgi:hypothetical protein
LLGALLSFVIESAEKDQGLAAEAVWTVQGLKLRLLGLGLDRKYAAVFALCNIDVFFGKCAKFEDPKIQVQIDAF